MGADNSGYARKCLLPETVRQLQKCGAIETENQIGCEMRWEAQCQTASEAKAGYPQREENAVEFFSVEMLVPTDRSNATSMAL